MSDDDEEEQEEHVYSDTFKSIFKPTWTPTTALLFHTTVFQTHKENEWLRKLLYIRTTIIYKEGIVDVLCKFLPIDITHIHVDEFVIMNRTQFEEASYVLKAHLKQMKGNLEAIIKLEMERQKLAVQLEGTMVAYKTMKDHEIGSGKSDRREQFISLMNVYNDVVSDLNYSSDECFASRSKLLFLETGTHSSRCINPIKEMQIETLKHNAPEEIRAVAVNPLRLPVFFLKVVEKTQIRAGLYSIIDRFMDFHTKSMSYHKLEEFSKPFRGEMCKEPRAQFSSAKANLIPARFRWAPANYSRMTERKRNTALRVYDSGLTHIKKNIVHKETSLKVLKEKINEHVEELREKIVQLETLWGMTIGDGKWLEKPLLRGLLLKDFLEIEESICTAI